MTIEWINYKNNGVLDYQMPFSPDYIKRISGEKTRVTLKDGSQKVGFTANRFTNNMLEIWTFDNLDEEKHELIDISGNRFAQTYIKIPLSDLVKIETIHDSTPRSGAILTNKFRTADNKDIKNI